MKALIRPAFTFFTLVLLAACNMPAAPTPPTSPPIPPTSSPALTSPPPPTAKIPPPAPPPPTVRAPKGAPSSAGDESIQPTFFGMTAVQGSDYPGVTFGTLGHPGIGAWSWIERQKGVYDFSLVDQFLDAAVAHGLVDKATNTLNASITLGSTPEWYASDPNSCKLNKNAAKKVCTSAPANIQDWVNFVTAVLNHYNGVTKPHIRTYELWNEANISLYWTGSNADMLKLAQAAYPIVHADPHSILLTPSVAGPVGDLTPESGSTWMAAYLEAGGAKYADGGAFHGYIALKGVNPYPNPEQDETPGCKKFKSCYGSILTKATSMRQVFDQHGLAGKPMFDTEGSWGDGNMTDPDTQAAWLARWVLLQAGLRSSQNLQMVIWFAWCETSFNWGSIEDAAGQPTPAGIAFNQVYTWLVGANLKQPCESLADGTWTCSLTRPGGYHALAVWNTQGSKSYTPGGADYTDYRDLAGKTVKIKKGAALTIGAKPILLETAPLKE